MLNHTSNELSRVPFVELMIPIIPEAEYFK